MIYQNLISSNSLPSTYNEFYKNATEPKITTQGDTKIVQAKIEWNSKTYHFKWSTTLSDDEIKKQFQAKLEIMLALGIRYNLGDKTTGIKYNLNNQQVERQKGTLQPKISVLDFDLQAKHIEEKITKLTNPGKTQTDKLKYRQDRIQWTKNIFTKLGVPTKLNNTPKIEVKKEHTTTTTTHTTPTTITATTTTPTSLKLATTTTTTHTTPTTITATTTTPTSLKLATTTTTTHTTPEIIKKKRKKSSTQIENRDNIELKTKTPQVDMYTKFKTAFAGMGTTFMETLQALE